MSDRVGQHWPGLERLQQFSAARRQRRATERCEMCSADVDPGHGHLVNVQRRSLMCVCRPCYLLFTQDGAGTGRFRAVPQRYLLLPELGAASGEWESLQLPIGLAFFFRTSVTGRIAALYPSPAGATESELPLDAWDALAAAVPALATLAPDVEALLVRRREAGTDAIIVPIDACYELTGRIRQHWRGFQGGDEVQREIDAFFTRAAARARETSLT